MPTVRAGLADIGIGCMSDDLSGLRADAIAEEPTVALVRREHPLTRARTVTLSEVGALTEFQARCPDLPLDELADRVAFSARPPGWGRRCEHCP
ncbi:LysR substrate binding domain protein [Actinomadura rubteroloni]|uniref:LysR substrate binding domain protein n=2 Tax=Actinomadura rubteroloni TaxID=1926885 RepID=A0A2P4UJS4_9ACTN|nr:LysR substrate binding domain protein [Actinomadura rubteroloni]